MSESRQLKALVFNTVTGESEEGECGRLDCITVRIAPVVAVSSRQSPPTPASSMKLNIECVRGARWACEPSNRWAIGDQSNLPLEANKKGHLLLYA